MNSKQRKEKILKKINKEKEREKSQKPVERKESVKPGRPTPVKKQPAFSNEKALKEEKLIKKISKEKSAYQKEQNGTQSGAKKVLSKCKKAGKKIKNKWKGMAPDRRYKVIGAWCVVLLVIIVCVGIIGSSIKNSKNEKRREEAKKDAQQTSVSGDSEATTEAQDTNPLTQCTEGDVYTLVTNYLTALRSADIATLKSLDIYQDSYNKEADFTNTQKVVEDYQNIQVYTKNGPYEDGVTAYVVTDIKLVGIDKTCQGMFQYIIRPAEDGTLKIDTTPEDDIEDDDVTNAMITLSQSDDVLMLIDSVNQQCENDIASDEKLKEYVNQTFGSANPAEAVEQEQASTEEITTEETTEETTEQAKKTSKKKTKKKKAAQE